MPMLNRPGAPGVQEAQGVTPEIEAMLLTRTEAITEKDVKKASEILRKYKEGKTHLEERIVEDELWWEQRHWEALGRGKRSKPIPDRGPEPTSA